jgi:uncharacterized protein with von Willebrand factor type A (vWA) domain
MFFKLLGHQLSSTCLRIHAKRRVSWSKSRTRSRIDVRKSLSSVFTGSGVAALSHFASYYPTRSAPALSL